MFNVKVFSKNCLTLQELNEVCSLNCGLQRHQCVLVGKLDKKIYPRNCFGAFTLASFLRTQCEDRGLSPRKDCSVEWFAW